MRTSHNNRRVAGSIPVVGSSRSKIGGLPTRAMATLSFLLLPPLQEQSHNKLSFLHLVVGHCIMVSSKNSLNHIV